MQGTVPKNRVCPPEKKPATGLPWKIHVFYDRFHLQNKLDRMCIRERFNMRIAVLSDIHGNQEAFTKVLEDIQRQQVNSIVTLGDNIGYGADSEEVIRMIRERDILSVKGNHELAVATPQVRRWFKLDARKALNQALSCLSDASVEYIQAMPTHARIPDGYLVHGFPPDSTRFYLYQISDVRLLETLQKMRESICFVGHTHQLRLVFAEGDRIHSRPVAEGTLSLDRQTKYIVNAGSVGQPRDGNPDAKYVIWEPAEFRLEVRSIPYDVATAAQKIRDAGIPARFADRLTEKRL